MSLLLRPAVVAVVVLAIAWALLPFAVGLGQDVEPELPVDAGLFVPEYGADGTYALHYRHHEEVTVTVPIRNRGPLPLRIDRADLESAPLPLLVAVGDNLPVDVGPWDTADVELTVRFDNCRHYHERSADTWDQMLVEGSVLGRGFDTEVALAYPLALHGQIINTCPDRTLTRGDDVRPR
ncbi:hypothetical protein D0Z08_09900 [Nocardioides immobilis]|uniref:Uncharacterized protein n=1 Tax=Nocardioides immobilis TaxID=2049295 RepID=A0A417Y4D4_9ACTN|nr:hypothetical protein [Nocardioides immobilis]RHW27447.1 hypothetical protein D0Z08_09900 [Nocardioides immobilis]